MMYWVREFWGHWKLHQQVMVELGVTTVISLFPLLAAVFVYNARSDSAFSLSVVFESALGGGQLFLYAFGVIGPVLYLSFWKSSPYHGPRKIFGFVGFILALVTVLIMGIDPTISSFKKAWIVNSSIIAYLCALMLNYLLLFYVSIDPPGAKETLRSGAESLKDAFKSMEKPE